MFPKRTPRTAAFAVDRNDPNDTYARLYSGDVVGRISSLRLPRYGLGNYLAATPAAPPTQAEARVIRDLCRAGTGEAGALVFVRTADGSSALSRWSAAGEVLTESPLAILKAAECPADEPALPRAANHHDLVRLAVEAAERDATTGGRLGGPRSIARRSYERLRRHLDTLLVMLARPHARFRPPPAWTEALRDGRLRLESPFEAEARGSPLANARRRNEALADRCAGLLVVHAHPGGGVERLALSVLAAGGKPLFTPDIPANRALLSAGAHPLPRGALPPGPWLPPPA